jgi:hypothetical protein
MATDETMIYNYPEILKIVKTNPHSRENAFYLNPSLTFSELIRREPLNTFELSRHPSNNAIEFLTKNPSCIDLKGLAENTNPNIEPLLEKYKDEINPYRHYTLSDSCNPAVMNFLERNPQNIEWFRLCANQCEQAIRLIEQNPDKITWMTLSSNSSAMHILLANPDKICWNGLSSNTHPRAIEMLGNALVEHPGRVLPLVLSRNPNAINIMMNHPGLFTLRCFMRNSNGFSYLENKMNDKIHLENIRSDLSHLSYNSNNIQILDKLWKLRRISSEILASTINSTFKISKGVFDLNYQAMSKMRSKTLYEELNRYIFHPVNMNKKIDRHLENGGTYEDFDFNL